MKKILWLFVLVAALVFCISCEENETSCQHSFGEWSVQKEATCKEPGVLIRSCLLCTEQQEKIVSTDHTNHTKEIIGATAPTCTEDGLTEGSVCSVCGEILLAQEVRPAKGHTFGEPSFVWSSDIEATAYFVCKHDSEHTQEIPALVKTVSSGERCDELIYTASVTFDEVTYSEERSIRLEKPLHTIKMLSAIDPTCTEDGLTEGSVCSVCGEILLAQEVRPAKGHTFGEPSFVWSSDIEATAYFVCKHDSEHTQEIPALVKMVPSGERCDELIYTASVTFDEVTYSEGRSIRLEKPLHTIKMLSAIAPTCTEDGLTEGSVCSVCGEVLLAQKKLPATGHTYKTVEERVPSAGAWRYVYSCLSCSDEYVVKSERIENVFFSEGDLDGTGVEMPSETAVRTVFLWAENMRIVIPSSLKATVFFYSKNSYLCQAEAPEGGALYIADHIPDNATSFRIVIRSKNGTALSPGAVSSSITFEKFGTLAEQVADVPDSIGAYHVLLRFEQMVKLTYYPLKDIPQKSYPFTANEKWQGIPYSSSRPEALFVPNNVSLYTFVTSLYNPNSYLYTVDLGEPPYNNQNGDTYYGAVCSTAAAYALHIQPNYSTHQWIEIPGMHVLEEQNVEALRLCDTIVGEGHVVMVTGIYRNIYGEITSILISEASGDAVKQHAMTLAQIKARYPASKYTYCRYDGVKDVPYTPSPYVAVGDEKPVSYTVDLPLIPRKGDKAAWLLGTDVEIDVLSPEGYTHAVVYRDGTRIMTVPIRPLLTLSSLEPGYYTVTLSDGEKESMPCSFAVIEVLSHAEALGHDGAVRVTFSSSRAKPLWVQWASTANGTVHIDTLTEEQINAKEAICAYNAGVYKIRVAFLTDYGIVHSELPEAILVR